MPGDDDTLFGNLPPGYQAMPSSTNIEDRRTPGYTAPPDPNLARLALNAQILGRYGPGAHAYDMDQWDWLQRNFPQNIPTTPLPDPDFSLDPSIMARAKAQQAGPTSAPYWMQPATIPQGPRSGPRLLDHILNLLGGGGA